MTERGVLITFEGGDGCGKSTQMARLAERLIALGGDVVVTREPGGTAIGESIRALLLDLESAGMSSRAELLLYEASRAQHVTEVIRPGLESGAIVLCDRFYDSTTAYQGYARGLPLDEIEGLNMAATGGLVPDLTLVYDIPPATGVARAAATEGADRLESEELVFHERVAEAYREIAKANPDRAVLVDAMGTVDEVFERTLAAATRLEPVVALLGTASDGEALL